MPLSYGVGVTERSQRSFIITDTYTYTRSLQRNTHPEQFLWQISSFVDASVHGDKALHRGLVSDVGIV